MDRLQPNRLDGRVAIVTGASRGMGKTIAEAMAAEGAAVAVVARTEAEWDQRLPGTIHDTVEQIRAAGGTAVAVAADLSEPDQVDRLYHEARDALGPIDILVNNAALTVPGQPPSTTDEARPARTGNRPRTDAVTYGSFTAVPGSFLTFPIRGFRRHLEIGLFATYRLMQLVLPDMLILGRGGIVNISSYAGLVPGEGPWPHPGSPMLFGYGGNKAAMHHLTQCVAYEMAAHGIPVNCLLPSEPIITPGNLVAMPGNDRWATPEDFAEATIRVALADPAVTTGQVLWSDDVLHPEADQRGWLGVRYGRES